MKRCAYRMSNRAQSKHSLYKKHIPSPPVYKAFYSRSWIQTTSEEYWIPVKWRLLLILALSGNLLPECAWNPVILLVLKFPTQIPDQHVHLPLRKAVPTQSRKIQKIGHNFTYLCVVQLQRIFDGRIPNRLFPGILESVVWIEELRDLRPGKMNNLTLSMCACIQLQYNFLNPVHSFLLHGY